MSDTSNSLTYCDRGLWFAREINATPDGLNPTYRMANPLSTATYHYQSRDGVSLELLPDEIAHLPPALNAFLQARSPDRILIVHRFPNGSPCEIQVPAARFCALSAIENDLFALDSAGRRLHRFKGVAKEIPPASLGPKNEPITASAIAPDHETFAFEGIEIEPDHRFVAWQEAAASELSMLLWRDQTDEIWHGRLRKGRVVVTAANLAIPPTVTRARTQIASACAAPRCLYLADVGTARILRVANEGSGLTCKVAFGDGVPELRIEKRQVMRLPRVTSVAWFALPWSLHPDVRSFFQDKGVALIRQSFLVAVNSDDSMPCAVTIKEEGGVKTMPLLGQFPDADKRVTNLANMSLRSKTRVTMGPDGALLFWVAGNSSFRILRPGFLEPGLSKQKMPDGQRVYKYS